MKWIQLIIIVIFASFQIAIGQTNTAAQQQQQRQLQNLLQAAQQQNQSATNQAPTAAQQTTTTTTTSVPTSSGNGNGNNVTPVDTGADVRDESFAAMTQSQLPMTPNQIRTLRKLFDETQRAVAEYPGVPPKPTSSSIVVNLAPGATPPIIRLLSGFVTSLVFVDATGAPWPIKAYDLGDPTGFDIQWDKKSNTLLVQSITQYKSANLAVLLDGLNTPVMITLMPGQAAVDYRVDLHVPGLGPNAFPLTDGLPGTESPILLNVLSGIPPDGSKTLNTIPQGYADVWLLDGNIYVRTRANILSPAWISTMSSSDGTHAYKMPLTPLMLVSLNGKPINLAVEGY